MKTKSLPILLAALVCAAVLPAEEQRIGGRRQSLAQLRKDAAAAREQMNAFETAQKAQLQMQEMGVKMGRAMFGGADRGK